MKEINHPALQDASSLPQKPLTNADHMVMPIYEIPGMRTQIAIQNGVERKLLFRTWGGLGDQICSEPTLRYAIKAFHDARVYLAGEIPELFEHLKFAHVFDTKSGDVLPNYDRYLCFDTIVNSDRLIWQFISHCLVNCVDWPSMCALRMQLPIEDKAIRMVGHKPDQHILDMLEGHKCVLVHAGKHWQSKTFPKQWWDDVLAALVERGLTPVLIGADVKSTPGMAADNRTTVDVDTSSCIDFRNLLTIKESIWLCQNSRVLITNDSSPLHMAATFDPSEPRMGRCWIGFIATCKHPDYIKHWRYADGEDDIPVFGWREENLGVDGIWNHMSHCPNNHAEVSVENIGDDLLASFLPKPTKVADWAKEKFDVYF